MTKERLMSKLLFYIAELNENLCLADKDDSIEFYQNEVNILIEEYKRINNASTQ